MADLVDLTVTQAAAEIAARRVSPVELTEALVARIERLDATLLAWALPTPERALAAARTAERDILRDGPRGPLHGVPYGAKDIFDTAGIRTAAGSRIWAERVPDRNAAVIDTLERSGAILLGKTQTCEFAATDPSPTRNPWNIHHTPGGSSSGSGAAVAARMAPMALGTQTIGSVLRPAAYNGVVGLKPSFGRISRAGVIPNALSFDHVGFLVRSVEDAALVFGVLAGHDPEDPYSEDRPTEDYVALMRRYDRAPRIGFIRRYFSEEADAETRLHTEQVVQLLAKAGADVEEIDPGIDFASAVEAHRTMQAPEQAAFHEPMFTGNEALYGSKLREAIERGMRMSALDYVRAQELLRDTIDKVRVALGRVDVVLTPTASGPAPRDLTQTGDTRFQSIWSFTGMPSISLPMGLTTDGLPLGLQLASAAFAEGKLLGAARWVERALALELRPPLD